MAVLVTMPKLGLTMTEGIVSKWYKAEGESIKQGEVLLEVSTDKITNQVEAPVAGIVRKILAEVGISVPVSAPLAIIAAADEDISGMLEDIGAAAPVRGDSSGQADSPAAVQLQGSPGANESIRAAVKASPAAKKLARDKGVDLVEVTGTGPGGRIVERDVAAFIEASSKGVKASPVAARMASDMGVDLGSIDKDTRIMKEDVLKAAASGAVSEGGSRIMPSAMRRVISERMTASWHTAPMVTLNLKADVTRLKQLRAELNEQCAAQGAKLSYNDILIKICAKALMEFPMVNASFDGQGILLHGDANVGLAVALEDGLIVPNVKAAQKKTLFEIALETDALIDKAKGGRLTAEDVSGGTFTITNLGMFGIETFTPIINQPESAILGVNAMEDRPVVADGRVEVRPIMYLSLTIDHRLIDGADGARFLARVKELIENPSLLLL